MNAIRAPAQFELEEAPVPGERCVDVVDLQRYVPPSLNSGSAFWTVNSVPRAFSENVAGSAPMKARGRPT